ncbi:Protein of unknown function DUF3425 [Ceraceosorus bombacis]|uniref:BZIP domain-containing protein n=1 Tax=Ceraceosorus bombacis TaxID=401625 RepID=A0A0P1BCL1_9BASI|nr:Protein of unknown function DUF3425 [Ceraceosorus bombacis]
MPAKAAESDPSLLLERRRAQNRRAQVRFRLKRASLAEASTSARRLEIAQASERSPTASAASHVRIEGSPGRHSLDVSAFADAVGSNHIDPHPGIQQVASDGSLMSSLSPVASSDPSHFVQGEQRGSSDSAMFDVDLRELAPDSLLEASVSNVSEISNRPASNADRQFRDAPTVHATREVVEHPHVSRTQPDALPSGVSRRLLWEVFADAGAADDSAQASESWWKNFWKSLHVNIPQHGSCARPTKIKGWPQGYQFAQLITKEKGMLAVCVFLSNEGTLEGLRRLPTVLDPGSTSAISFTHPFIKAYYHNAITLGYLEEDLRAGDGMSNIRDIWSRRGGPSSGLRTRTPASKNMWIDLPSALTREEEKFRLKRLEETANLHPTELQLKTRHPSMVDVLPWPELRDALIALTMSNLVPYASLKGDLLGRPWQCTGSGHTFCIHGDDPGDEEAWEMSASFARKYRPVLPAKLLKRTNWWRRMRGEPNITFCPSEEVDITSHHAQTLLSDYFSKLACTDASSDGADHSAATNGAAEPHKSADTSEEESVQHLKLVTDTHIANTSSDILAAASSVHSTLTPHFTSLDTAAGDCVRNWDHHAAMLASLGLNFETF